MIKVKVTYFHDIPLLVAQHIKAQRILTFTLRHFKFAA